MGCFGLSMGSLGYIGVNRWTLVQVHLSQTPKKDKIFLTRQTISISQEM